MSRITVDFTNALSDRVAEHGLDPAAFERALPELRRLTERLNETRDTGWERWRGLPFDPMRSEYVHAVRAIADRLRPTTENLIVLGIGGSALGNIALQQALNPMTYNLLPRRVTECTAQTAESAVNSPTRDGPRLFVLDNVDPHFVGDVLAEVQRTDPGFERTVVNVISKSGETAETAAQFMIARSMLKDDLGDAHAKHIVAVTDPTKGTMREICDAEGYATLPVPDGVGGRFSVLSPVGLLSAAMCGINIDGLLDGAAAMDERCRLADAADNPAAVLAWLLIEHARRGKSNHVLMPYCNALDSLADWYRQLWAESLGKRVDRDGNEIFAGATPIKALGATDQHSQIQLYREGPNDKVIGFVEVERFEHDLSIPSDLDIETLRYLHGRTLGELLNAEKRATEYALIESGRPSYTIRLPMVNAHHVGEFLQLWMIATAYAGLMLNIDAYDQPAVETGKVATFGLMGRTGYEQWNSNVNRALGGKRRVV